MADKPTVQKFPFEDRFFSSASLNCDEPIVFHYTGAPGALGIVQSGELWCTLVHHMNDSAELKFALEQARALAYSKAKDWDPDRRRRLIDELTLQYERVEQIHVFAASFSEGEDLLSQWRGYAGIGGYCIGFSLESLRKVAKSQNFLVGEVLYDHASQNSLLDPIISSLLKDCDQNDLQKSEAGSLDKIFWPHTMAVVRVAPRIKHSAFSEEREWRVYSDPYFDHTNKYDFVVRGNEIVPIVKLSLDNGTIPGRRGNLKDICARTYGVGPGPNQRERSAAYLAAVHRYGVHWRLASQSKAPLR